MEIELNDITLMWVSQNPNVVILTRWSGTLSNLMYVRMGVFCACRLQWAGRGYVVFAGYKVLI